MDRHATVESGSENRVSCSVLASASCIGLSAAPSLSGVFGLTIIYTHNVKMVDNFGRRGIIENRIEHGLGGGGIYGIPILREFSSQSLFKSKESYRKTENWDAGELLVTIARTILDKRFSGKKVLEVGCGNAYTLAKYAENGAFVYGRDLTDASISISKQRFAQRGL